MNTHKSFAQKTRVVMALIILMSALLFLASCQKDEQQQLSSNQSTTINDLKNIEHSDDVPMSFTFISIDHQTMESGKPDYFVSVLSNGSVTYEGRKNVTTKHLVKWRVSIEQLRAINQLCLEFTSSITRMNTNQTVSNEKLPILDQVITTYIPNNLIPHTYIDFDNGKPEKLIKFRTKLEEVLKIERLTKGKTNLANAIVHE